MSLAVGEIFSLKYILIEFAIPNQCLVIFYYKLTYVVRGLTEVILQQKNVFDTGIKASRYKNVIPQFYSSHLFIFFLELS